MSPLPGFVPPPSATPHSFLEVDYLEDRRPNSQGDPCAIASRILQTIAAVPAAS